MTARDRWISRHLRRLRIGQFLERAGEWLAGFLIVFAVSVLLVKRLRPEWWPHVLWLAPAALPVTVIAWWLAKRRAFTRDESIALLDRTLGAGGLLMALAERPDADWEAHLPQVEERWRGALPRIRPRRLASCLVLPMVFAAGVCFVPLREIPANAPPPPLTAGQQAAQRLEQLLASLQEAEVLAEEQNEALTEEIRKLVEETRRAPRTHEKWEVIDALERQMRGELSKAQLQVDKLAAGVGALLRATVSENGLELTEEQLEQLEEEILETLMKMEEHAGGSASSGGMAGLEELVQRLTKQGMQEAQLPSDPGERQQLLQDLQQFLQQEQQRLAELRGEQAGEGACLQCGAACQQGGQLCQQCEGNAAGEQGQGGVSRGRGDAALSWGEELEQQGFKFKAVALPPGFEEDAKEETLGVRLTAPKVEPAAASPRDAVRETAPVSGRETWDRKLRPRHKQVVKEFFESSGG